MKSVFMLIFAFFFTIGIVTANGAGNYIDKTVNGFLFEFGIEPKEPKADERAIMSLSVHNSSTKEPLNIDNLWIRISKGNEIFFTSNDFRIRADGPMFFVYTFKEGGKYKIDFSIKYNNEDFRTDFFVNVKRNNKIILNSIIIFIAAFILGYATAIFKTKYKTNKHNK